jgi:hypothetical protein
VSESVIVFAVNDVLLLMTVKLWKKFAVIMLTHNIKECCFGEEF